MARRGVITFVTGNRNKLEVRGREGECVCVCSFFFSSSLLLHFFSSSLPLFSLSLSDVSYLTVFLSLFLSLSLSLSLSVSLIS